MLKIPKPQPYNWREHTKPENKSRLSNSRTVPDQTYSIREIMDKFTSGQPINGMVQYLDFDGDYENSSRENPDFDGFMPHPKTLDLVDRQLMAKRAKEELKAIDKRKKDREAQDKATRDKDQKIINDLQAKLALLEKPLPEAGK